MRILVYLLVKDIERCQLSSINLSFFFITDKLQILNFKSNVSYLLRGVRV